MIPDTCFMYCLAVKWEKRNVNFSYKSGTVPTSLNIASVKKPDLDPDDLNNYWPISNLPFLAKILERSLTTSSLLMIQAASASWFCISAALDTDSRTVLPHCLSSSPFPSCFHSCSSNRQRCCFRRLVVFSFLWMAGSTSLGCTPTLKHLRSNCASFTNSCFSPLRALAPQYLSELPPRTNATIEPAVFPLPSGTLPIEIWLVPTRDSNSFKSLC